MTCKQCIHEKVCPHLKDEDAERCEQYADKSRFIELPCKVGDWIWYVYRDEINKAKVEEIKYDASKHGYYSYSFVVYAYDFKNKREVSYYPINETMKNKANINEVEGMGFDESVYVFLTREEAKEEMKKRTEAHSDSRQTNRENFAEK